MMGTTVWSTQVAAVVAAVGVAVVQAKGLTVVTGRIGTSVSTHPTTRNMGQLINNSIRKVQEEGRIHTYHLPSLQLLPHPRLHGSSLRHRT